MNRVLLLLFVFCSGTTLAQRGDENQSIDSLKWVRRDVPYIISPIERQSFESLDNDPDRARFIADFWLRRDPTPGTESNEFREEHYVRWAYANENFQSGIPGWMTDRGLVYVLFGKPDKVEKIQTVFAGFDDVSVEKWSYAFLSYLGGKQEFVFADPTGTQEFRLTNLTADDLLDQTIRRAPKCLSCWNTVPPTKLVPLPKKLRRSFPEPYCVGAMIDNTALKFETELVPLVLQNQKTAIGFEFAIEKNELVFDGRESAAQVGVFVKITRKNGRGVMFEEVVTLRREGYSRKPGRSLQFHKLVELPAGSYMIEIAVRDTRSGNKGTILRDFKLV